MEKTSLPSFASMVLFHGATRKFVVQTWTRREVEGEAVHRCAGDNPLSIGHALLTETVLSVGDPDRPKM